MSKVRLHAIDHTKKTPQLFSIIRDAKLMEVPSFDNEARRFDEADDRAFPALVLMSWPNGYPCIEMELYLLYLAQNGSRVDEHGGSVRQEAVKLSHLVRYCYHHKLNFWELWSNHFSDFLYRLIKELKANGQTKRESTHVIEISDSCVRFLTWLQSAVLPHRYLVDIKGNKHQILLVIKKTIDSTGGVHFSRRFSGNPSPSTPRLKEPMPKESIDALFSAISSKSDALRSNPSFTSNFDSSHSLECYLDFRSACWATILTLCMATGCRPSELASMSLSVSISAMFPNKQLILNTKKREPDARRKIRVNMGVVIKVSSYIKSRGRFLEQLRAAGKHPEPADALFLNSEGNPLTKETLTRGFDRLCDDAGLVNRTCISMFRHRAITTLIAIHLQEFCLPRLEVAMQALNDSDYMTILTKVAQITGHKRPESLKPYIHLAWEELGAFDTVQAAVKIHAMLLTVVNDLTPNLKKLERAPMKEQKAYLDQFLLYAKEAAKEMEEALAAFQHVKANPDLLKDRELMT